MRTCLLLFALASFGSPIALLGQYTNPPASKASAPQAKLPPACPWLTQGTAAQTLGGDVSVVLNVSDSGEGSCKFSREQGPPDTLEIVVKKADLPGCPADSIMLRAIGNEAMMCRHAGANGEVVQMVSSRVRDQHFLVTITSHGHEKVAKVSDPQDEPVARVSEQVAGSLF
jgi:hypothetical protein